jgi:hypothetical protein
MMCCAIVAIITVQSYTETRHPLDVYETITVVQSFSDYFQGTKTGTTVSGTLDACRPAGYQFTGESNFTQLPSIGANSALLGCALALRCAADSISSSCKITSPRFAQHAALWLYYAAH